MIQGSGSKSELYVDSYICIRKDRYLRDHFVTKRTQVSARLTCQLIVFAVRENVYKHQQKLMIMSIIVSCYIQIV